MGGKTERAPVTSITGCGGSVNVDMQTATGIFWPDAHKEPELMAKLAIAGYEIGGIEYVKLPFHNIAEADALGCKTRYPEQRHLHPVVVENPYFVTVADGSLAKNMVTPEVLNRYIKPALIRLEKNLHGIRLLYIGGKEEPMVPFLAECGYDGISVDETVNIARIKSIVGEVKVLGNISSKKTLTQGTSEEVRTEVKKAIADGADLIEPSCGIPPETPTTNIKAMVEAVKKCGCNLRC